MSPGGTKQYYPYLLDGHGEISGEHSVAGGVLDPEGSLGADLYSLGWRVSWEGVIKGGREVEGRDGAGGHCEVYVLVDDWDGRCAVCTADRTGEGERDDAINLLNDERGGL